MIKLWCSKVGSNLDLKTVEEEWPSAEEVELNKRQESLTIMNQSFTYSFVLCFRIYNFYNDLLTS